MARHGVARRDVLPGLAGPRLPRLGIEVGEITYLATLQIRLGTGECQRGVRACELVGRQDSFAGDFVGDPPPIELSNPIDLIPAYLAVSLP